MKRVSGKAICRVLAQRGWRLLRTRGSHHIYGHDEQSIRVTVPVHGNRTLPPGTQRAIMRRAGLTDADL